MIRLNLTDDEAHDVHTAIAITIALLEQVEPGPGAVIGPGAIPGLERVARRLDHERRHAGPNPHGP